MNKIILGKVGDVYEVSEDKLLIITTNKILSFDVILGN